MRPLIAAVLALATVTSAHAKELKSFSVGNWTAGAYAHDDTNTFNHCAATASYRNGHDMFVSVSRRYTWSIGFLNPDWQLIVGQKLSMAYRIDGGPWFDVDATPITKYAIELPMPDDGTLIRLFRQGHLLEIAQGTFRAQFALEGTSRLLAALVDCVTAQLNAEDAARNSKSVVAEPPTKAPVSTSAAAQPNTSSTSPTISTGTAFSVSTAGHLVTNNHVIEGCSTVTVRPPGEAATTATVVIADKQDDLALLKMPGPVDQSRVARLSAGRAAPAGKAIAVYGFPLAGALSSTGNIVAGNITAVAGLNDDINVYQISAPVQPGNSGGPLLDYSGSVIGVVNAKLNDIAWAKETGDIPQNVNFAIKASVLANFLDAHSVDFMSQPSEATLDLAGVASLAKKFTMLVICAP